MNYSLIDIGYSIRQLRKDKNWTQQKLATELGITQKSLSLIESGRSDFRVSLIAKLSYLFNVDPNFILLKEKSEILNNQELKSLKKRIAELERNNLALTKSILVDK